MTRLEELKQKLEIIEFLQSFINADIDIVPEDQISPGRIKGLELLREFSKIKIEELLDEKPLEEKKDIFSEKEILVLKAMAMKHLNNPKVSSVFDGKAIPPEDVQVTTFPTKRNKPIIKATPPTKEKGVNGWIGRTGKVIDSEDVQGASVDSGEPFRVISKHSVDGYWRVRSLRNPDKEFLIDDASHEWDGAND